MAVRLRKLWLPVALLTLVTWGDLASAQFNPRGRKRPGASTPPTANPSPTPRPRAPTQTKPKGGTSTPPTTSPRANQTPAPNPTAPNPNSAPAPTDSQAAGPRATAVSQEVLIGRYTSTVLQQPGVLFPLQRLGELYRQRDGNLDAFRADFEKRLTTSPNSLPVLLALAWIADGEGERARAEELLQRAHASSPKHPAPLLALAHSREASGDKLAAATLLERALPLQTEALEREQTLRTLRGWALDLRDVPRAKKYHEQLLRLAQGSGFVRGELGKELLARRMNQEAVVAFEEAAKAAHGDNRALAPALRDLAKAQAAVGSTDAAIKTLERALRLTAEDSGTRREILDVMVEAYRAANRVPELITLLERESHRDAGKLTLLASLYEEGGRLDDALAAYRRALSTSANDTDVRLKLIRLLELRGDLDAAVTEYRHLVRTNPRNPEYVFRLADLYQKLGNAKAALDELNRLGERSKTDPEVLAATVDFYERIGESDKALALLERLVSQSPRDYHHLIALGERYFAAGNEKRAQTTWRKLLEIVPDRARAEFLLGEVYLEHDLTAEALRSLAKACELAPDNLQYRKTLALALERTGATSGKAGRASNYAEAQALWEAILTRAETPAAQREARQHITTLWSLQGSLKDRVAPLNAAFRTKPPHLPSGRMLAEVYERLSQLPNAEGVLRELTKLTPTDVATWMSLERVLVAQRKLTDAAEVAQRLLQLEPKRSLEHYQRLARYAADSYRDDEAIEYAAKAVALNPDDAEGHRRLGDMYRRRQDVEQALSHYRLALTKNDRLFPVYFDVAELLLLKGQPDEADQLLRNVVRNAVEDELIARAARQSMQLHVASGDFSSLERELLPLSLTRANKPIYRSLLLEIYGAWMLPLAQQAKSSDATVATRAKAELAAIGKRSVKPLLDALTDPKSDQQRTAIDLLTHIRNPNANLPLFTFATTSTDPTLQTRAMMAIGLAGASNVVGQLEGLLFSDNRAVVDESSPMALAAAWSYCNVSSKATSDKLLLLARSDAPTAQALALIALAERRDARLLDVLADLDEGTPPVIRAAGAYALGQLRAHSPQLEASRPWAKHRTSLHQSAQSADPLLRATALSALARFGDPEVPDLVARALVHSDPAVRERAVRAMAVYAERAPTNKARPSTTFPEPATDSGRLDVVRILEGLLPPPATPTRAAALLPLLENALTREARAALQRSESAVSVITSLLMTPPTLGWLPLTARLDAVPPDVRQRALDTARRIAESLSGEFIVHSSHPDVGVRTAAVRVLTTQTSDAARAAIQDVFTRGDEETCRAVLAALADFPNPTLLGSVADLLSSRRPWPLRQLAAVTLGRIAPQLAKVPVVEARSAVTQTLHTTVRDDSNAFVREQSDPEVKVRTTAAELLRGLE
jgi:tetratricopeptide (TPR) repeat protein/HEAT repeat protein